MNFRFLSFAFNKRNKLMAGFLCAVLLASTVCLPQKAFAAENDGLIYGTNTDSYTNESTDSISIGSEKKDTSAPSTSTGNAADGKGNADGLVIEMATASGNSGVSSGNGASNEELSQAQTESGAESKGTGLIYGARSADLFGVQNRFLTISGKTNTSSVVSYGANFTEVYYALQVYSYLRTAGFGSASACGVLGNIMRESWFDPTAVNATDGAYGLFQCVGDLKTRLEEACTDVTDVMQQTRAMIEKIAPDLFERYGGNANNITYDAFKKLTDPGDAAEIWRAVVERNNYTAHDTSERQRFAQNYYNQWANYDGGGLDIIEEAMKYLGGKYVYGGDSLLTGIDCSHYICSILRLTGHYNGEYRTSFQLRTVGTEVASLADAEPGDILCWNGHVAFYITDGFYINAASVRSGICIGSGDIVNQFGGLITIRRVR